MNLYNQQVDCYKMKSLNRLIGGHVPKFKSKLGNKKEIGTSAVKCQITWAYSHLIFFFFKEKKEKKKRLHQRRNIFGVFSLFWGFFILSGGGVCLKSFFREIFGFVSLFVFC